MAGDPDGYNADLTRDWVTIWQSEVNAAATDRERAETLARIATGWSRGSATPPVLPVQADGPAGHAARQPSPRPASADASPAAGDGPVADLALRVDELVRRVGELERLLAGLAPTH